ncbi:MAG: hypothetical protein QXT45_04120 [Candidatus Bilamarchaeaceae archaeon]
MKLSEEEATRLGGAAQELLENDAFRLMVSELQKQAMQLMRESNKLSDLIHAKAMLMTADSIVTFIQALVDRHKIIEFAREKRYKNNLGGEL